MNYTTQMDAAKKGIITKEMQVVSEKEGINIETLMNLMAEGKIVIPANKNHKSISAEGVGQGLRTKINVNLGISKDCANIELELEKVKKAIRNKVYLEYDIYQEIIRNYRRIIKLLNKKKLATYLPYFKDKRIIERIEREIYS